MGEREELKQKLAGRDDKIAMIQKMARESLDIWQDERQALIVEADKVFDDMSEIDKQTIEMMKAIFGVADQLTEAVRNCIDIKCPITPEVVAIVSSMIRGITNGHGAKEVETLMAIRNLAKNSSASSH